MGKSITKVLYKPGTQSTDEYMIIVNAEEYEKYKAGDTSIPLSMVVESFDVYFSNQGNQGILGKPSKQQLETVFGTSKDVDVVNIMIREGKKQSSETIQNGPFGSTNVTRSSIIDHRSGPVR